MEPEVKSQILSEETEQGQPAVDQETETSNDAMQVIERDGVVDRVIGHSADEINYTTDTSGSAELSSYKVKSGKYEGIMDEYGELITDYSTTDVKRQWLGKKYTPKAPLVRDISAPSPTLNQLVTVGKGTVANNVHGTPREPNLVNKYVPKALFIDGKTHQEDVHQGNVGDCYFLSAILQVIHYDPKYITKMMHVVGDEVYTDFYHREGDEESGYHWVRKPIAIKWGVSKQDETDDEGNIYTTTVGSSVRIKNSPEKQVKWAASFEGDALKIDKETYYQAALWVNCIERAFADFSKIYGQYGQGDEGSEFFDRYDNNINGGWDGFCLRMFYGNDVEDQEAEENSDYDESLKLNESTLIGDSENTNMLDGAEKLLGYMTKLSLSNSNQSADQVHIGVSSFEDYGVYDRIVFYADRLIAELKSRLKNNPEPDQKEGYEVAIGTFEDIKEEVEAYKQAEPAEGDREGDKSEEQIAISYALHENELMLENNTYFQALKLPDYISIRSVLATLIGDKGNDIYMYTHHAYNVREINFVGKDGNPINVAQLYTNDSETGEQTLDFAKLKEILDLDKTTVVIQNPHGETKAVYAGQVESQEAVGTWKTTLRELLASVTDFTAVIVKNQDKSRMGKADVKAVDTGAGMKPTNK